MFRVNIRTTLASIVSLVEFEQVNVCCDVIKSLLNGCWTTWKMLCIKCCPSSSNFSWHNVLLYNPLLNKNAGDTFTLKEKVNHYSKKAVDMEASKIKKGKSRTRPVEMKKILGGAAVYEILWATMVGRRRKFFISNCLKRLERLIFVVGEDCKFPS